MKYSQKTILIWQISDYKLVRKLFSWLPISRDDIIAWDRTVRLPVSSPREASVVNQFGL